MTTTALLWFRRDLRLADHPALTRRIFNPVLLQQHKFDPGGDYVRRWV